MKLIHGTTIILLMLLVGGCATTTSNYCDVASPLYFGSEETIQYLVKHDRPLLSDIVAHNETTERLCK